MSRQPIGTAWLRETAYLQMLAEADRVFPDETGGVLVGYWAVPFQEVVLTDAIGPGPRALHQSQRFVPDSEYQEVEIARYYLKSRRLHTYLGDWHTHPNSTSSLSRPDRKALKTIARHPAARAPMPIMAILAGSSRWKLTVWCGFPIRIGRMIVKIRTTAFQTKIFQG
jgi:integrative and conjugative element protein (TIGR02256 family)